MHDLLDKVVLDEGRRNVGRVDGVVLELRPGAAPVVSAFEIGGRVWARRAPRKGREVGGGTRQAMARFGERCHPLRDA